MKILASGRLQHERIGHTLNATALVHEAYMKLVDQSRGEWQSRAHFYAVASEAMKRILVSHARARNAKKRGGGAVHVELRPGDAVLDGRELDPLEALSEALERLEEFDERGAAVVTYRFFGGLTYDEIAEVMATSSATVRRSWTAARAWLRVELGGEWEEVPDP